MYRAQRNPNQRCEYAYGILHDLSGRDQMDALTEEPLPLICDLDKSSAEPYNKWIHSLKLTSMCKRSEPQSTLGLTQFTRFQVLQCSI